MYTRLAVLCVYVTDDWCVEDGRNTHTCQGREVTGTRLHGADSGDVCSTCCASATVIVSASWLCWCMPRVDGARFGPALPRSSWITGWFSCRRLLAVFLPTDMSVCSAEVFAVKEVLWQSVCVTIVFLPHSVHCGRFCFFGAASLWFFVCVWNISGNRRTDLHQIHTEDLFAPSLGRVQRSTIKVTRDKKRHFRWTAFSLCLVKHL